MLLAHDYHSEDVVDEIRTKADDTRLRKCCLFTSVRQYECNSAHMRRVLRPSAQCVAQWFPIGRISPPRGNLPQQGGGVQQLFSGSRGGTVGFKGALWSSAVLLWTHVIILYQLYLNHLYIYRHCEIIVYKKHQAQPSD